MVHLVSLKVGICRTSLLADGDPRMCNMFRLVPDNATTRRSDLRTLAVSVRPGLRLQVSKFVLERQVSGECARRVQPILHLLNSR